MATRKSMSNRLIDSTIHSSPASSSPLRRKSILPQKLNNFALSENDDEAERLARRKEITDTSTTTITSINSNDKRRSLGLSFLVNMPPSQMAERISQCIKLGTENKINPKNAFSLEMIDFMTYMIKKKDANMSNLQVATTSLDVSTKIYGFRVDGVHMDILKMIAGVDKQNKYNENQNNMEKMNSQEVEENNFDRQKQEKKKKKKNKQKIFATVDTLKINIETEKPSLITIEADLQTTDMLYQVMLPNHANSKFYPHPYNDILIDTVNNKDIQDKNIVYNIPKIANFSHMEICPPLFYFDFHSWNADDELEKIQSEQSNENRFQFDLNASLSNEDECISTGMNYFDIEVTEEEHIDRCVMISNQVENIVDFREVLTKTMSLKDSEYSFIQTNLNIHWAGPSHWKVINFKKSLFSNNAETQHYQSKVKKKNKEIELCYDDETIGKVCAKFLPSQSIKLHARTAKIEWNEEILTLPPDKHYNIKQANKLYLHTTIFKNSENINDINTTSLINDMENYNHINENDTLNYSNNYQEYQENENNAINNDMQSQDEYISETQMPFTGNNLVAAPKLTNKLSIAYCTHPKRIDMKQLKYSIWECLKCNTDKNIQETITKKAMQRDTNNKMNDSKFFSEIYKRLPNILTKTNIEALSFPISFVSLLHLANEKTLKINSSSDMSDLIIEQD
ncbi:condensin complex subunit 2 [Apis cerana]|uniref:Condensin complex subunit 2 n=1 Tax=Apis cerana cerana TaxID=94128 RepID=A0A2A3EIE0_APICC|nr:condensin complex subunit 2 [Apis cerana]XP_061942987.1 condensin complex subunit 2 [Apis cerana]XP_061942988.1 condensin complex subunit 2 [Apis cerana]PBC30969.1 Condensin complex subunit [Apis cerana cerana]